MITHTTALTVEDLSGILDLQQRNLAKNISAAEAGSQGFLTVVHSLNELKTLNDEEQHQIIKSGDAVVGYILAMTKNAKAAIPVLLPMFELFDQLIFRGKPISAYDYMVVGQVCIAAEFRGTGLLNECYDAYRERFSPTYAFAVTEIAMSNTRSRKAHERIGFAEIHQFTDTDGIIWSVVIWDWHA